MCRYFWGSSSLSISLLSMKIIQSRLQKHQQTSWEEQAGYKPIGAANNHHLSTGRGKLRVWKVNHCILQIFIWLYSLNHPVEGIREKSTCHWRQSNFSIQWPSKQHADPKWCIQYISHPNWNPPGRSCFSPAFQYCNWHNYKDQEPVWSSVQHNFLTDLMFANNSVIFANIDAEPTDIVYDTATLPTSKA